MQHSKFKNLKKNKSMKQKLLLEMGMAITECALHELRGVSHTHRHRHHSKRRNRKGKPLPLHGRRTTRRSRFSVRRIRCSRQIDEMHRGISFFFYQPIGAFLGQSAKQKRSQRSDLPVQILRIQRSLPRFPRFPRFPRLGDTGRGGDLDQIGDVFGFDERDTGNK